MARPVFRKLSKSKKRLNISTTLEAIANLPYTDSVQYLRRDKGVVRAHYIMVSKIQRWLDGFISVPSGVCPVSWRALLIALTELRHPVLLSKECMVFVEAGFKAGAVVCRKDEDLSHPSGVDIDVWCVRVANTSNTRAGTGIVTFVEHRSSGSMRVSCECFEWDYHGLFCLHFLLSSLRKFIGEVAVGSDSGLSLEQRQVADAAGRRLAALITSTDSFFHRTGVYTGDYTAPSAAIRPSQRCVGQDDEWGPLDDCADNGPGFTRPSDHESDSDPDLLTRFIPKHAVVALVDEVRDIVSEAVHNDLPLAKSTARTLSRRDLDTLQLVVDALRVASGGVPAPRTTAAASGPGARLFSAARDAPVGSSRPQSLLAPSVYAKHYGHSFQTTKYTDTDSDVEDDGTTPTGGVESEQLSRLVDLQFQSAVESGACARAVADFLRFMLSGTLISNCSIVELSHMYNFFAFSDAAVPLGIARDTLSGPGGITRSPTDTLDEVGTCGFMDIISCPSHSCIARLQISPLLHCMSYSQLAGAWSGQFAADFNALVAHHVPSLQSTVLVYVYRTAWRVGTLHAPAAHASPGTPYLSRTWSFCIHWPRGCCRAPFWQPTSVPSAVVT